MSNIEEKGSPFHTWTTFYDTIQLLEPEYSESTIKTLADIVNSENLTNTFVYNSNGSTSYETCNLMIQRYKDFTVWFLGRFFYMLSVDHLVGVHKLIMDVQLRILHLISIKQPDSYIDLAKEYSGVLKQIHTYQSSGKMEVDALEIKAFNPKEFNKLKDRMVLNGITIKVGPKPNLEKLKLKLLIFIKHNIMNKLTSFNITSSLFDDFDSLIFILKEDRLKLKISVLNMYKNILDNDLIHIDDFSEDLNSKFAAINALIEHFTYSILTNKIKISDTNFGILQEVLVSIFDVDAKSFVENKLRIAKFIVNSSSTNSLKNISDKLTTKICQFLFNANFNFEIDHRKVFESVDLDNTCLFLQSLYCTIFNDVKDFIKSHLEQNLKINVSDFSETWRRVDSGMKSKLNQLNCSNRRCVIVSTLNFVAKIFDIIFKVKLRTTVILQGKNINKFNIEFFNNSDLFLDLISFINTHIQNCKSQLPHENFIKVITILPTVSPADNVDIYFHIIAYQFLPLFYKSNNELPVNLRGRCDTGKAKTNLKLLYNNLAFYQENKDNCLRSVIYFVNLLGNLSHNIDDIQRHNLEANTMKIVADVFTNGIASLQCVLSTGICHLVSFFKNVEFVPKMLLHLIQNDAVCAKVSNILQDLVCILLSSHVKVMTLNNAKLEIEYLCIDCNFENSHSDLINEAIAKSKHADDIFLISNKEETRKKINEKDLLRVIWKMHENNNYTKKDFVKVLPSLSRHIFAFNTKEFILQWMSYAENSEKIVRLNFSQVAYSILKSCLDSENLPKENKEEIVKIFMVELFKSSKKSLQFSNYDLQDTILETVDSITQLKSKTVTLDCLKILLYFIMIPTSRYQGIAENYFSALVSKQNTKAVLIYGKFRKELCEYIVELCAINQALVKYSLSKSLDTVSLVLGFFGPKDFITKENHYLMPYFVSLIVTMPDVLSLINEAATVTEVELKELLANNYGNIFLYIFLNKNEVTFKACMRYVEQTTGMSGPSLRKRNFRTILNELLLNFHDKQERVLLALKLLAMEDTDGQPIPLAKIPDYLQPRFLGVLQYFDTKLFAKKQVLLCLAKIFEFMGPVRIAPFRLKIIAMLRTALNLNYSNYPELNCNVWDAFIRSCDIESLGPQLATIFVSLLPLSATFPEKINPIFAYLLIEKEHLLKAHIADLFFVLEFDVKPDIKSVIEGYTTNLERSSFKIQIKLLMKYLTHETNEIRVHALKYLRRIIAENHKELDQMILGYNGIDDVIIELVDALMLSCREKDSTVKLASGECIGELGAIEPSHLPRKYTEAASFNFFITEDAFVFNSLNELIRALQAEKNTTIMDRFALAIQETLRMYGISPHSTSPKHNLWKNFPQSHKELILPFLSSRYTMGQCLEPVSVSPIYGSKIGVNFQSWVHNWTTSLILTITADKRSLLEVCLPSLKQDQRTLMHFLPHILLHSLLEGDATDVRKCYEEFMAVINSFNSKKEIDVEMYYSRPLRSSQFTAKPRGVASEFGKQNQCTKVIFVLLDFLDRWIREWEWQKGASRSDDSFKRIKTFLSKFCKLQLARCSFQCGEYSRTLMYLEDYVINNNNEFRNHLSFLAQVYAQLDEPDAVAGVSALQHTEPTLEQRILALEVTGKLADAAACYERIPLPLKLNHLQGLIQCYLDLDNVNTALNVVQGAIGKQPEYEKQLFAMEAEPLWRLGQYDELDELLNKPEMSSSDCWGVNIGKTLLYMKKGDRNSFKSMLNKLKLQQVELLGATSLEEGAYQHGYGSIVNLHALNELELVERTIYALLLKPNDHKVVENIISEMSTDLELRLKVVQESIKIIEPILCLRRVVLNQAKQIIQGKVIDSTQLIDAILGESWLRSAKIARHAGVHQQAYTYSLKAEEYAPPKLFLEKAELHWMREQHEQALTILSRGIENLMPEVHATNSVEKKKICAEAKLLIASYNDSISNVEREVNIMHYKEALEMDKECEKSYVCLAQYYDRIFCTYSEEEKDAKCGDIQIHMINYFGKSLLFGTKYIYQSMPRMLSIWFDYGTRLLDVKNITAREERRQNLLRMTKLIDSSLDKLPAYMFLTAFSQIISRICHPQKEVYIELKSIIIKLILQYPQHSMWMMISVIKSSYTLRSRRCAEILGDPRLKNPSILSLVTDFTKLAEKLIELCNKDVPDNVNETNINMLLRSLPRLLAKEGFSEIMIPTQKFRKLVLPNPEFKGTNHNPFPNHYAHITGIEETVVILTSLQRPRKIIFRGSDGKGYVQMLKPKDDLRKDFRLMEFNDIVNQLLSSDPESRQRRLNIRLYSVAPLNEECGLIEWIHNLVGLRIILMNIYKQRGQYMKGKELKEVCCNTKDTLSKKREIFEKKLLPRHPPVLGDWFRKTFPDAQSWLTARTAYIRTTAVMSVVGYILGLGDRHGENILLDSTSGDAVHVDFNCLFNKGETFEWPERVPFRLTHNMVSAMGPLGVEGVFRKSCACSLKVLRAHTNTLMSIVTPFVYDPLVSWPRNATAASSGQNMERTNEQAVEHVRNIELRLQGICKSRGRSFSIPLSIDGQSNNIIQEAMSIDNLCQMYIGWGAYL